MWPWEHLAVGYVLFSLGIRGYTGERPSHAAAIAVAIGTQFPDLVDKPLAWTLAVVQSGVSVAHSVFVATALAAVAVLVARRFDRPAVGAGFAVGYLSHLPADSIYPLFLGDEPTFAAFLWPLVRAEGAGGGGFIEHFAYYLHRFVAFLGTPRGLGFLALEVTLLGLACWLWITDGRPGLVRPWRLGTAVRNG